MSEARGHYGVLRLENVPRIERKALLEDALNFHSEDLADKAIVMPSRASFGFVGNSLNEQSVCIIAANCK